MSKNVLRAGAAAGAVVLSALTGLATNLLTNQPSWGIGAAVVVLVLAGIALAVAVTMLEQRGSTPPEQAPEPSVPGQSGFSQYAYSADGRTTQAGRDIRSGMPAGYVVLCLLIVATVAVGVLLVAVKLAPLSGVNASAVDGPASTTRSIVTRVVDRGETLECSSQEYYFPVDGATLEMTLPKTMTHDDAYKYTPRFAQWVTNQNGWRQTNWLRFTVQNKLESAVVLTGLSINIVGEESLTSKAKIVGDDGCGAPAVPRTFGVDFAKRPPKLDAIAGRDENGKTIPAIKFPFKVSSTDPEVFDLTVTAGPEADIRWTASLAYTQDGRGYEATIDDGGRPFHSVPKGAVTSYGLHEDGVLTKVGE
jgi:hypothetical protein